MTTDGTYTAVVDRFEDDLAVLLLEADGETVDELVVDRETLPEAGQSVDAVLEVTVDDGALVAVTYDDEKTDTRANEAQSRFDALSQRPPSAEDDNSS